MIAWGGPAPRTLTSTLVASRTALPPEGAVIAWGSPARYTLTATGLIFPGVARLAIAVSALQ